MDLVRVDVHLGQLAEMYTWQINTTLESDIDSAIHDVRTTGRQSHKALCWRITCSSSTIKQCLLKGKKTQQVICAS